DLDKEDAREGPVGLGYRVPLVIASPWSRGGWVNSQVFDITSTLQFMEKFLSKKTGKKIKESNISDWRRTVSGNLTSVFRPYSGEKVDLPQSVQFDPFVKEIYNAKFKDIPADYKPLSDVEIQLLRKDVFNSSLMPLQEKGTRQSCALPYQLEVDGKLTGDKKSFEISFSAGNELFGDHSAGSAFTVYAPGKYLDKNSNQNTFEEVKAWSFAVKAGDKIKAEWPLSDFENWRYHLRVYGPNGFFREFSGSKNDPVIDIQIEEERSKISKKPNGSIIISLENKNNESHSFYIENKYNNEKSNIVLNKNNLSKKHLVNLEKNFNWYDISIKITGNNTFEKRYAGRVETGNPGKSDPIMGRV
ncbi:MAG: phospholipase domain-containing protein, partial [Ginsengibacter sp.]